MEKYRTAFFWHLAGGKLVLLKNYQLISFLLLYIYLHNIISFVKLNKPSRHETTRDMSELIIRVIWFRKVRQYLGLDWLEVTFL